MQGYVASSFSLLVFTRKLVVTPSISLRKLTDLLLKPVGRRTMWRSEAVQYVLLICDALLSPLELFSPEAGPSRTRSSKLPQQNHPLSPLHEPLHGELNAIRKQNAFSAVLSTEGRAIGLCRAELRPKGPKGLGPLRRAMWREELSMAALVPRSTCGQITWRVNCDAESSF